MEPSNKELVLSEETLTFNSTKPNTGDPDKFNTSTVEETVLIVKCNH